ncbi:immunity 53 family protein [Brevibacillus fortis]|nr:immunity 53 family protein [Brevibacillus fortis]
MDLEMELIKWLENYYSSNCDGDWEHGYGITICTIDNPGWSIKVNLRETPLENKRPFQKYVVERTENDWVHCRLKDGCFEAFGGPKNLNEILEFFKQWAES